MSDPYKTAEMPVAIMPDVAPSTVEGESAPATQRAPSMVAVEELGAGAATEKAIAIPASATRDRATLTVLTGLHAGQLFGMEGVETVVGRGPNADVVIDDSAISRRHASFVRSEAGKFTVSDLGSTNGTFVRGRAIQLVALSSGDRVQLGPSLVLRFAVTDETEEALLRRLYESSTRDALTGAFNRKYFAERLGTEAAYAERHSTALAVLMIDVDHFKAINDRWGHLVGDQVLRALANTITRTIRKEDVFARYGGEEFAVLARAAQPVDAERLAERLRATIEGLRVPTANAILPITVSIGVAYLSECKGPPDVDLVALADGRLYRAKAAGRNRVVSR